MVKKVKSKSKPSATSEKREASDASLKTSTIVSTPLIEPWPEQEKAIEFVLENNEAALLGEQRTGKTVITLHVLDNLPRHSLCVVLVCILNNKETTWLEHLRKYLPWLNVTQSWEDFKKLPFPKLLLIHHEALHTVAKKIKGKKWINFAIVDEAHRWKARGSRMSRAGAKLSYIKRKLILTGTPQDKDPRDWWAQFRFLAPHVFGDWGKFERTFLDFQRIDMEGVPKGTARWKMKIIQQGMLRSKAKFIERKLPLFISMVEPYCLRISKEDVGILRPTIERVMVDLKGKQRLLYDQMKKDRVIHVDGHRVMAPMKVTEIVKRRELASGFVIDDDGLDLYVGDAKLRRLMLMLEELHKPVVIFTEFVPELNMISAALEEFEYDFRVLSGETPKRERPVVQRLFQRAQLDVLLCQSRAGGVGIDLWRANSAICHSIGYSRIIFEQMSSRLDAKHKKTAAKIFVLTARATIDEDLYDLVIDKGLDANQVLQQLKRGAK